MSKATAHEQQTAPFYYKPEELLKQTSDGQSVIVNIAAQYSTEMMEALGEDWAARSPNRVYIPIAAQSTTFFDDENREVTVKDTMTGKCGIEDIAPLLQANQARPLEILAPLIKGDHYTSFVIKIDANNLATVFYNDSLKHESPESAYAYINVGEEDRVLTLCRNAGLRINGHGIQRSANVLLQPDGFACGPMTFVNADRVLNASEVTAPIPSIAQIRAAQLRLLTPFAHELSKSTIILNALREFAKKHPDSELTQVNLRELNTGLKAAIEWQYKIPQANWQNSQVFKYLNGVLTGIRLQEKAISALKVSQGDMKAAENAITDARCSTPSHDFQRRYFDQLSTTQAAAELAFHISQEQASVSEKATWIQKLHRVVEKIMVLFGQDSITRMYKSDQKLAQQLTAEEEAAELLRRKVAQQREQDDAVIASTIAEVSDMQNQAKTMALFKAERGAEGMVKSFHEQREKLAKPVREINNRLRDELREEGDEVKRKDLQSRIDANKKVLGDLYDLTDSSGLPSTTLLSPSSSSSPSPTPKKQTQLGKGSQTGLHR